MSLSELLISLSLSALISCVLLNQYAAVNHMNTVQEQLFQRHFDQILLDKFIRQAIFHAGYVPCGSQKQFSVWDARQQKRRSLTALSVKNNKLQARYMYPEYRTIQSMRKQNTVWIKSTSALHRNQPVLLSNCQFQEINQISSIDKHGKMMAVHLAYTSQLRLESTSYIGGWTEDNLSFQQQSIWFGGKRQDKLNLSIERFHIKRMDNNLVDVQWQFARQPPERLILRAVNA